jgi:EpsI family protein
MGAPARDMPIDKDEVAKSGVSDYINRLYFLDPDTPAALYVGYHATQQGDKRMHSPTLCLPGSGWTPVGEGIVTVPVNGQPVQVNRFILQSSSQRILVYYWFQGRGRLTTGQGALKLNAMRDALVSHRDEEALVRIIVPLPRDSTAAIGNTGLPADSVATRLASAVVEPLNRALPAAP